MKGGINILFIGITVLAINTLAMCKKLLDCICTYVFSFHLRSSVFFLTSKKCDRRVECEYLCKSYNYML